LFETQSADTRTLSKCPNGLPSCPWVLKYCTSISPTSPEAILTNPVIVGYDPTWPATFQQLRDRLAARLGPLAIAIEHIGSTAVPGLAAKPIIDLDVVIADRADLSAVIQRLGPLGYHHEGDLGVPGREAFTTPAGAPPHHLYVCAADAPALNRHLAFRDTLRANAGLAQAYGDLKRDLAAKLGHYRAGYTEAKTRFVEDVLARASTALPRQPIDPAAQEALELYERKGNLVAAARARQRLERLPGP
jgi:GrpB-like predicted nucleotidyltransferase (UPF0157 family)